MSCSVWRVCGLCSIALMACAPDGSVGEGGVQGALSSSADALDAGELTPLYPDGSLATDGAMLYAANTLLNTVSCVDPQSGEIRSELSLSGAPSRIAVGEDGALFVSLRAQAQIAILSASAECVLSLAGVLDVGAEPVDVAVSGERLYVAAAAEGQVEERDLDSGALVRRWAVDGQPRWLALHPDGEDLYVAAAYGAGVHHIDLTSGEQAQILLPDFVAADETRPDALVARITGDLALSPAGDALAIPLLLIEPTEPSDDDDGDDEQEDDEPSPGNYGGSVGTSSGSGGVDGDPRLPGNNIVNPVIFEIPLGEGGGAEVEDAALLGFMDGELHSSYPSGVFYSPSGESLWIPVEGSGLVMSLEREALEGAAESTPVTLQLRAQVVAEVPGHPRGLAFVGDTPYSYGFIAQQIARLDVAEIDAMRDSAREQLWQSGTTSWEETLLPWHDYTHPVLRDGAAETFDASGGQLPADLEDGLRLFFAANNPRVSNPESGVSCATCHAEGRNDGMTWVLPAGMRQTPSLAGRISQTAPYTWMDEVPTVQEEALLTSSLRMGGLGLRRHDAGKIAMVIERFPLPPVPVGLDPEAVARGQGVFHLAGCAECHIGDALANPQPYAILRAQLVSTPTLRGIGMTAPYFHDGSAPDLESVLDEDNMGDVEALSGSERADLIAYLRAL